MAAMITGIHICEAMAAWKTKNFPRNPTVSGTPAREAMITVVATARIGLRLARPSSASMLSLPLCTRMMLRMKNAAIVMIR